MVVSESCIIGKHKKEIGGPCSQNAYNQRAPYPVIIFLSLLKILRIITQLSSFLWISPRVQCDDHILFLIRKI